MRGYTCHEQMQYNAYNAIQATHQRQHTCARGSNLQCLQYTLMQCSPPTMQRQSKNIPTARQLCIHQSGQHGHCEQLDVAGRFTSISLVDNDTCTVLNQADLKYLCSTSQHSLQYHHPLTLPGSKDDNLDHPANGSDYNPQTQQASHHTHQIICLTRSYFGLTWSVCLTNCHHYHQHHHDCQHPVNYRT